MLRRLLISATIFASTALQAELPVQGVDPLKLEADWASSAIVENLIYSSANCRDDYNACGVQSTFIDLNESGITDDGRIATLWIGRWFHEPWSRPLTQRIWAEVVYIEFWTGTTPFTDYTAASVAIHGINYWNFVDQVLEKASANKKGKVTLTAPGWYGVHIDESADTVKPAAPADITLTAIVTKTPGGSEGSVEINMLIETQ